MRCDEVREILEEAKAEELSAPVREHLAKCAACETYARDWRLVEMGFRALRAEPAPETSPGFATRLVRRLEEAAETGDVGLEFLEVVGRRVVYATVLLAFTLLLAMALPSSGPLRGPSAAELFFAQPENLTAENDPIFADDLAESYVTPPTGQTNEGEKRQK